MFIFHGYTKIIAYNDILPMLTNIIGIGSKLSFNLLIFAEFFCGILIAIALLTRLAAIPVFIAMVVPYFIAHGKDPFVVKELAFVFLLLSIVVFILGSGKFSVDKIIFKK